MNYRDEDAAAEQELRDGLAAMSVPMSPGARIADPWSRVVMADSPRRAMTGLATVTVQRTRLLEKLKANRDTHQSEYQAADQAYRVAAAKELKALHKAAMDAVETGAEIKRGITAPKPEDHTEDYDRVIEMVDMSVGEEIELTNMEFAQYVCDDWGWKAGFTQTASFYK